VPSSLSSYMQSTGLIDDRESRIARIAESKEGLAALQQHVTEIIEGAAFKGSHRSGQFLKYIVDQAIAGNFKSLKERVIGMELFGRSPSYDTGEDAIVRVTASDVRKRLLQHYGKFGTHSDFRISLPLGSYLPEISRDGSDQLAALSTVHSAHGQESAHHDPEELHAPAKEHEVGAAAILPDHGEASRHSGRYLWLVFAALLVTLNLALWIYVWPGSILRPSASTLPLPWSALFRSSHATQLITSDPNIVEIQGFTGGQLSVSDYANHNYLLGPNKLTPEEVLFCHRILRGDKASTFDTAIAVNIEDLAQANSKKVAVRGARDIQLSDLKTDDNFIFLGSSRSNPWTALYNDQLDFQFVLDANTKSEFIRNVHPRPHEQLTYVPTAPGWATGQSFAIVALVQNRDQNGQVLLLAGANAEGTEAAGKLATDATRFAPLLRACGIASPTQHFELLLRLNAIAGSPDHIQMVACHLLPSASSQGA
jgi:hypothetical protein